MRSRLLILFLVLWSTASFAEQNIPKGYVVESVRSAYDPNQTHAVYVPGSYSAEKKWPVLICFDPRAQGKVPAELFREGAEKHGWIIISSNHFQSDTEDGSQNLQVLKAMWSDARKWFSVDERRIYTTGFSGGSRLAWGVGYIFPQNVAGVIGVGAGIHEERPPSKSTTFVWYGIVGNKDFNYLEMSRLDQRLASLEIPHRFASFDGFHAWPPPEYCTQAMDWMELQAIKRNLRTKDETWIAQYFDRERREAQHLETSKRLFEAYEKYLQLKADFHGLVDPGDIPVKVATLAKSDRVKKSLNEKQKREEKEDRLQKQFLQILDQFSISAELPSTARLKSDLNISRYQKEIKEKGAFSPDSLMLQRVLEGIYAQVSFYLPQFLFNRKAYDRAIISLSIASEIHPESPWIWYRLALAHVQDGDKKKTIENLKLAIDRGLDNRKWVEEEKAFDPVRNDPAFQQLVERIPPQ